MKVAGEVNLAMRDLGVICAALRPSTGPKDLGHSGKGAHDLGGVVEEFKVLHEVDRLFDVR
jgi:hypothetical protein